MPRNFLTSLLTIVRRFLLFIARKVLSFLLPIPFFPSVTSVLATLVGINPLTLEPPSVKIPTVLQKLLPTSFVSAFLKPAKPQFKALRSDTIELGEKVRTWRQRHLATETERKVAHEVAELTDRAKKIVTRQNIQDLDFGGSIQKEMAKVIDDSVGALEHVYPHRPPHIAHHIVDEF
jgi:hypothetical protein